MMEFRIFLLVIIVMVFGGLSHLSTVKTMKCLLFDGKKRDVSCTGINNNCKHVKSCETGCLAIFRNKSGVFMPAMANCNPTQCKSGKRKQCILEHYHFVSNDHNLYGCCCMDDMCNLNYVVNVTHMTPKPTHAPTSQPYQTDIVVIHKPPKGRIFYYILIPLFGFVIFVAVLISLWRKHKNSMRRRAPLRKATPPPTPPLMLKPIQMHEVISRGQFGCVWRATYEHCEVAVKVIQYYERASWETERKIYSEYKLMHKNILSFHSAEKRSENGVFQFWIITEFHSNGSLADYLHKSILNYETLMKLTLSMVKGLAYLHKENIHSVPLKPIIAHRDFKSRNVLVKNDLSCCISDFGSACAFLPGVENEAAKAQVGTKRYMSPEVIQGMISFKYQSYLRIDIYALALVMWECLSRTNVGSELVEPYCVPYEEFVGVHPTIDEMEDIVVRQQLRPFLKDEWRNHERLHEYCTTIEDCWDDDSEARLSADCAYERLSLLMGDNVIPSPHSVMLSNNHIDIVELSDSKPLLNSSNSLSEGTAEHFYLQCDTENTYV